MFGNPYTPGAGCIPPFLAGRNTTLNKAQVSLERLKAGYPQRSTLYYGLRGVGKTALLNTIEEYADNLSVQYAHIEALEDKLFIKRLIAVIGRFLRSMSIAEATKNLRDKCIKLLASFSLTYNIKDYTFGLSMDADESVSTGIIDEDLTEIFLTLGKIARDNRETICIFIDEIQFLQTEQLRPLITALHRCNQLRLPISIWCAGLPKAVGMVNKSCSYAERMFDYIEIGRLDNEETIAAIVEPAAVIGVHYEDEALLEICETTKGYPYFIQEYCSVIWDSLNEGTDLVRKEDVLLAQSMFYEKLDSGFFEARYSRCSTTEKAFMRSMAECSHLPSPINEVAQKMGKSVQQISTIRATLIDKGIIYAPQRGEVDFTVPLFGQYLHRTSQVD